MIYYIYKLYYNDYYYIGSTKDIKKRYINHKIHCFNGKGKRYNLKIYKKIRDLNITKDNFNKFVKYKIICYIPLKENIKKYENMFINLKDNFCLNSKRENQGFNSNVYQKKYYQKKYYQENKEHIKEKNKKNNEKNKEKIKKYQKEYKKKYYENNKEHIKEQNKKYRKYNCDICNTNKMNKSDYKDHLKTKKHLKNKKKINNIF